MLFTSTIRKNNLPVPGDLSGGRSFVTAETMQPPSLFGTERAADSIRGFKFENSEIIPEELFFLHQMGCSKGRICSKKSQTKLHIEI
ncbi:uncharacterized protein [Scyliorhinus torazame]|uniref:uncharacterized protein isoform X3 n=1 Tax=Scyliorhinus torazame TaxID=75743 RepID=UPI003B5B58E1